MKFKNFLSAYCREIICIVFTLCMLTAIWYLSLKEWPNPFILFGCCIITLIAQGKMYTLAWAQSPNKKWDAFFRKNFAVLTIGEIILSHWVTIDWNERIFLYYVTLSCISILIFIFSSMLINCKELHNTVPLLTIYQTKCVLEFVTIRTTGTKNEFTHKYGEKAYNYLLQNGFIRQYIHDNNTRWTVTPLGTKEHYRFSKQK